MPRRKIESEKTVNCPSEILAMELGSCINAIPQNEFGGALFVEALKLYQPFQEHNVDLNDISQVYEAASKYTKLTSERVKRDGGLK